MSLIKPNELFPATGGSCSIIMPVFNGLEYTRRCITALFEDASATPFELIVIDNGSTDGLENWLATVTEQIRLIRSGSNVGFAKACNISAEAARGDYLLFLNNDTLPTEGWLDRMVETMKSDDKIGIVGAKLIFPQTRLIQHAGIAIDSAFYLRHVYENFPEDHPAASHRRDLQALSAACMLVKSDLFKRLGSFDAQFINGYEDFDFCLRAREQGARIVYEPAAVVFHFGGLTPGRRDHEVQNANHFNSRWSGRLVPDLERILAEDGYEIVEVNGQLGINPRGVNLADELAAARKKLQEGRLVEAEKLFRRLYYLAPHSHEVISYLERIFMRQGAYDDAWAMGQRLVLFKPEAGSLLRLAECALKRGAYDLSRRYADGTLEMLPPNDHRIPEALAISGDAAFKAGELQIAKRIYLQGLAADSACVRCLIGVGAIALTEQNPSEARNRFAAAADHWPHSARARLGLGLALESLGDAKGALKSYRLAVECDSDNISALLSAVRLLTTFGQSDEAIKLAGKYLSKWPDDPEALAAQADSMLTAKDFEGALQATARLKTYAPNHPKLAELSARK